MSTSNPAWDNPLHTALLDDFPEPGPAAEPVLAAQVPWNRYRSTAVGPQPSPQPRRPGCDVCGYAESSGLLTVAWSTAYANDVADMTLTIGEQSYLIASLVHPGDEISTTIDATGVTSALLSWIIAGETMSGSEQISIVE